MILHLDPFVWLDAPVEETNMKDRSTRLLLPSLAAFTGLGGALTLLRWHLGPSHAGGGSCHTFRHAYLVSCRDEAGCLLPTLPGKPDARMPSRVG